MSLPLVRIVFVAAIVAAVGFSVFTAMDGGDEWCEHSLGDGYTYLEGQPIADQQLDCVAPNGTVIRDVDVKPMNVTSGVSTSSEGET